MRKEVTGTDPPGSSTGTPRQEGAHHTKLVGRSYATGKFRATQNCLESSSDPRIKDYLRFLSRELIYSDDPIELRAFLSAHYSYNKFQRLGTPACRRYAWHTIQLACRLSAKSRHIDTKGSSSDAILGQPGTSGSHGGADK